MATRKTGRRSVMFAPVRGERVIDHIQGQESIIEKWHVFSDGLHNSLAVFWVVAFHDSDAPKRAIHLGKISTLITSPFRKIAKGGLST